ncbi:MAG: flagellin [Fidelibacterota bacterium]
MGSDLTRIGANIEALQSLGSLSSINRKIGMHQLRLATGKKINSTEEDPAGYQIARGLESRRRGLEVALANVGTAKNVLNIAEGGYQTIMDLLQTMKEKATQAADVSLSSTQRSAINDQVGALISEIDAIVTETSFNGVALIDGSYSAKKFHTGEGASNELSVTLNGADSADLTISTVSLSTAASASAAIGTLGTAIDTLASRLQDVGEFKSRLTAKEQTLAVAITNTEEARSLVEDADFAKEQMEVMKLQILQQTAVASLAQANASPQVVLSLFG